jgi:hypothetical protein
MWQKERGSAGMMVGRGGEECDGGGLGRGVWKGVCEDGESLFGVIRG